MTMILTAIHYAFWKSSTMLFCIFFYFGERNTNAVFTASLKFDAPKNFA